MKLTERIRALLARKIPKDYVLIAFVIGLVLTLVITLLIDLFLEFLRGGF